MGMEEDFRLPVLDGIKRLTDLLSEVRSSRRNNWLIRREIDLFDSYLQDNLEVFKEKLPITVAGRKLGSLNKELELAADDVEFHHRQGSFKTWNAKETSQKLQALQNCLDVYFKLALDVPNPELDSKVLLHSDEDSEFVDPITGKLMYDPVKGSDDCTYDRWTIINTGEFSLDPHLTIKCDDVDLRERLFTKFHLQGVESICSERRRAYRNRAFELAKEGHDEDAVVMLENVLEWDENDTECRKWSQAIMSESTVDRDQGALALDAEEEETNMENVAPQRSPSPGSAVDEGLQLVKFEATPIVLQWLLDSIEFPEDESKTGQSERAVRDFANLAQRDEYMVKMASFHGALERLVALISEEVPEGMQAEAARALANLACSRDNIPTISAVPHAVERLVGRLARDGKNTVQEEAAKALANLTRPDMEYNPARIKIAKLPKALARLVALLSRRVTLGAKVQSLRTLANLALETEHVRSIWSEPKALERIVEHLSSNTSRSLQYEAARLVSNLTRGLPTAEKVKLAEFKGVLEGLVRLMSRNVLLSIRCEAVEAFVNLASEKENQDRLASFMGAGESLVSLIFSEEKSLIAKEEGVHFQAARAFFDLIHENEQNKVKMGAIPGAFESLFSLLSSKEPENVQALAAATLAVLAESEINKVRMPLVPQGLGRVVRLLSQGVPRSVQSGAVELFANLASAKENRLTLAVYPEAQPNLSRLLCGPAYEGVQKQAVIAFAHLVKEENDIVTVHIKDILATALHGLVGLLSTEASESLLYEAARALFILAKRAEYQTQIVSSPGTLERLVELMSSGVSERVQTEATSTFAYLASKDENMEVLVKIPNATQSLVDLMAVEVPISTRHEAVRAFALLTWKDANRSAMVTIPSAVQRLVALLSTDVSEPIRFQAAIAFGNLATAHEMNVQIASLGDVLRTLVDLLARDADTTERLQEKSALAFANLAHYKENKEAMAGFPNAMGALVKLFSREVPANIRVQAVRAFGSLAEESANKSYMFAYPLAVERLVGLLSSGVPRDLQYQAARACAYLAQDNKLIMVTLARFPGAVEKVTNLLTKQVAVERMEVAGEALKTFGYLAEAKENREKMSNPDALRRLLSLMDVGVPQVIRVLAARAFRILAQEEENMVKMLETPGCLKILVDLISPEVPDALQQEAVGAFAFLACNSEDNCKIKTQMLAFPQVLPRLVRLLSDDDNISDGVRYEATVAFAHLATAKKNKVQMASYPQAIQNLVGLLSRKVDERIQEQAMKAFSHLAQAEQNKSKMAEALALGRIVDLLSMEVPVRVRYEAALAFSHLAKAKENKVSMAKTPGALQNLANILSANDEREERVRIEAATALAYLAEAKENRPAMNMYVDRVAKLAVSTNPMEKKQAGKALSLLIGMKDGRNMRSVSMRSVSMRF